MSVIFGFCYSLYLLFIFIYIICVYYIIYIIFILFIIRIYYIIYYIYYIYIFFSDRYYQHYVWIQNHRQRGNVSDGHPVVAKGDAALLFWFCFGQIQNSLPHTEIHQTLKSAIKIILSGITFLYIEH